MSKVTEEREGEESRVGRRGEKQRGVETLLYNSEGWFCDAALQREIALHLTYRLFAQFPLCTTVHLGSGCSLPVLLSSSPHEIIANPALPTPKSDRAERPCALFKISNEQTHVPVAASYYRARRTYIRLLFAQLIAQRTKKKKRKLVGLRQRSCQLKGAIWLLCGTG